MTDVHVQQTLDGETTVEPRNRPNTWNWCHECEDWILRSSWLQHKDHSEDAAPDPDDGDDEDEDEDDKPERVGGVYDITLEYSVTYRFRVPAWSEHEAKERAKDLQLDARPGDSHLLHSEDREMAEIMSDDPKLPDDYDPYGSEMLWEVYGDAE